MHLRRPIYDMIVSARLMWRSVRSLTPTLRTFKTIDCLPDALLRKKLRTRDCIVLIPKNFPVTHQPVLRNRFQHEYSSYLIKVRLQACDRLPNQALLQETWVREYPVRQWLPRFSRRRRLLDWSGLQALLFRRHQLMEIFLM